MKSFTAVIAFAALACGFLASNVRADDYPMTGQDTVYRAERSGLSLFDKNRQAVALTQDHPYRLRFSNQSKSFTIMPGDGKAYEFKIQGGFPGGNLRDFEIDGALFGNPGIHLSKHDRTKTTTLNTTERDYNCSWICGREYVCRDVPETICETRYERICHQVRDEVCRIENGQRICTPIFRTVCETVPRQYCRTVYRRVCEYENRYCYGTETWKVQDVLTQLLFELNITDNQGNGAIGQFGAVLDSHTDTRRIELIRTTCR